MKSLKDYINNVVQESTGPCEGDQFDIVLNEEFAIQTDIVAVEDNNVYIGLDENAFALLERAGLLELADDPNYQGSTGTALGGKPATPAAAAVAPAPSGSTNPQAGAKPIQSGAGLLAQQQKAAAAGSPAPTPVGTKVYPASDAMTLKMAQQTSGRAGTSTAPKTPKPKSTGGGAPANPQQQTAPGQAPNTSGFQNAAAASAPKAPNTSGFQNAAAASAAKAPTPQANALGVMPQTNVPGSPTATAEPTATAPQANALGVMPQAQVAGSPTATDQPAAAQTNTSKTPGLDSATTPQGQAVGGETVPTRGGPAVTGGFGQETNVTTDSPDQIARRGPMGTTLPDPAAQRAQGEKNLQSIKNFIGIGNKPAATTPAPAGDQTAGGKTNADFLPGAAGGGGARTQAVPEPNIERVPAATAQTPSTMAEDAEFARMLNLAGVRRG